MYRKYPVPFTFLLLRHPVLCKMRWSSVAFPPSQSPVTFLIPVSKRPSAPPYQAIKPAASHQSRRLPRLRSSKRPPGLLSRRVLNLPFLLAVQ
ncbi:hypothetical protein HPB47_015996 [Ixodes persulcatus]|uniref:Uncharacterized protein n=1 Tax=Ixodes persulcatus TaxID=34615 RepID=A0AC60QUK0_IXOPE|nr:hypothetical protein HPB47_015996 [Ixodes persulcatus]